MQAIFFDSEGKKVESLLNVTQESVTGFFLNSPNSSQCALVELNEHVSGEVRIVGNVLKIGSMEIVPSTQIETGVFDFDYYSNTSDTFSPELTQQINENLTHIYNGGELINVPNPMPYSKSVNIEIIEFVVQSEISDIVIVNRPQ